MAFCEGFITFAAKITHYLFMEEKILTDGEEKKSLSFVEQFVKEDLEAGKNLVKESIATYHDFRELIHDPNVDIVHIATPPHWHALMTIEAAKAGKDIWCEKPMTRTIGEGKRVVETVQQFGRMFRLNTWFLWLRHSRQATKETCTKRSTWLASESYHQQIYWFRLEILLGR